MSPLLCLSGCHYPTCLSTLSTVSLLYSLLLPHIWIGAGDTAFWPDVVFEHVLAYCSSRKHLRHSTNVCYVTNPGLRSPNNLPEILKAKELKIRVDYHPLMQVFGLDRLIKLKIVLLSIIDHKNLA